jgi:hypothetical protein
MKTKSNQPRKGGNIPGIGNGTGSFLEATLSFSFSKVVTGYGSAIHGNLVA